jgi:hypothetical protein
MSLQGAEPIRKLFKALHWRFPALDPLLLRGLIVIAQISGALPRRPNIWLTSRSQAGKTTLRERAIRPLMPFYFGTFGVDSTAAGIRQKLASDSLRWSFDESEADTISAQSPIKGVLRLLRGARATRTAEPLSTQLVPDSSESSDYLQPCRELDSSRIKLFLSWSTNSPLRAGRGNLLGRTG